jgi:hypothetical protein
VLYVVALLVVIALIVAALWLSGLLMSKAADNRPGKVGPATSIIAVGLLAFAVGLFAGIGTSKDADPAASSPVAMPFPDKEADAFAPKTNKDGFMGTLVKPPVKTDGADSAPQTNSGGDLGAMAKRLEKKMESDPKNGEGWLLLARAYLETRQHGKAVESFAKAAALLPPDATMLADWADANVVVHDRKWDDTSRDIVKRALAADKKNLKALSLAGSESFDRGNYKAAIDYWKQMKEVAPVGSMFAKLADANIEEATTLLKAGKR